jgi:hypothetical protein
MNVPITASYECSHYRRSNLSITERKFMVQRGLILVRALV